MVSVLTLAEVHQIKCYMKSEVCETKCHMELSATRSDIPHTWMWWGHLLDPWEPPLESYVLYQYGENAIP